jgi:hypothetical protein
VAFTTTALDSVTSFNHRNETDLNFVAWTDPPTPPPRHAAVADRHVFYNGSSYDGGDFGANAADDAAIATDKAALLPGQTPAFTHVTSYDKGINGVMVDIANLPPAGAALTAEDFELKVGTGGDPAGWANGLRPLGVVVRRGAGSSQSDRVTLTWADDAVRKTWLQVTVKANEHTGLERPDVFYFGNLAGETGDNDAAPFRVNALDLAAVKKNLNTNAPVTSRYDFNRDGRINALDVAALKQNLGRSLSAPAAPAPPALPPATASIPITLRHTWDDAPPDMLA